MAVDRNRNMVIDIDMKNFEFFIPNSYVASRRNFHSLADSFKIRTDDRDIFCQGFNGIGSLGFIRKQFSKKSVERFETVPSVIIGILSVGFRHNF